MTKMRRISWVWNMTKGPSLFSPSYSRLRNSVSTLCVILGSSIFCRPLPHWWRTAAGQTNETVNRWRTVVSATWKYDDPRLNMSHEGAARVWHVQPRVVIFPCRLTNYELLRWLVETPSRDFAYYRLSGGRRIFTTCRELTSWHVDTCHEVSSWHVVNILRPPDSR